MKFVRGRAYPRWLWCGILGCLSTIFAFEAFQINSWTKWRKNPAFCLPLPPPLGCSDEEASREVLLGEETDFAWLSFISIFPSCGFVFSCLLLSTEHDLHSDALRELISARFRTIFTLLSACLNFLTLIIATLRTKIVTTVARKQSLFQYSGMSAVYSTSFYLVLLATLCSVGSTICDRFASGRAEFCRLAKTVKQHVARNLMYPDKRSAKMITFSSMNPEMEEAAAEITVRASMQFKLEEDIAEHVKQNFEARFGPTWHCAVGSTFGSAVHHRANEYIEIAMPQLSVLLFRCDEPKHPKAKSHPVFPEPTSSSSLC